jgi:hypothetical protein
MEKRTLIESAGLLEPLNAEAQNEYSEKSGLITHSVNRLMLSRNDLSELIGENNAQVMKDNHSNHTKFMISVFHHPNKAVFTETIIWVFRTYLNRGFSVRYWYVQLDCWLDVLNKHLSPESFRQIQPYYLWIKENIPVFVKLSDIETEGKKPKLNE